MARHRKSRPRWFWLALAGLSLSLAGLALSFTALLLSTSTPQSVPPRPPGYHVAVPGKPPVLPPGARPGRAHLPPRYTVRPGDTLWAIAGRWCGTPLAWPVLYRANRAVIGPDPDLIYAGQRYLLACAYHAGKGEQPL